MINTGEKTFYETIKDNCKVIFDVGCREDTYYSENSENKIFYLFEPNPTSYINCKNKIDNLVDNKTIKTNKIHLFNYGLGNKTMTHEYYLETQSFFERKRILPKEAKPVKLFIHRFSEFLKENNIDKIDFLKIDTEGFEPEILLDNIDFIKNNVKYVQFEWASTWYDKTECIPFPDIYNMYKNNFSFYFVYDPDHPFADCYSEMLTSIVSQEDYEAFEEAVSIGYGSNIAMIRRKSK